MLATQSSSIRPIRCAEIFLYDQYPVVFSIRDVMGFGMPMDYEPLLATRGAQSGAWGPSINLVAAGLGITLDGLREQYDRVAADRRIETASGVIEPGSMRGDQGPDHRSRRRMGRHHDRARQPHGTGRRP